MAPSTTTPVTVAGKHILKFCRQGSIASARLPWCRASTHTTSIGPQLFPSKHTLRQLGGTRYSSVTPRAFVSFRRRMAAQNAAPLVWIDCEVKTSSPIVHGSYRHVLGSSNTDKSMQMTGLDYNNDEIIEIYCLITNGNLVLADPEGWGTVVHQPQERMDQMNEWCTRTHGQTGLTAAVVASDVTPEQAADGLLAYIKKHVPEPRTAILAGNSVHADQAFLRREPYRKVVDYLHYRILDVSSLKEAARRWSPRVLENAPPKKTLHKAKDDILESIEEARFYKESIYEKR